MINDPKMLHEEAGPCMHIVLRHMHTRAHPPLSAGSINLEAKDNVSLCLSPSTWNPPPIPSRTAIGPNMPDADLARHFGGARAAALLDVLS